MSSNLVKEDMEIDVGIDTKRGAELASHVFRCLIENRQPKQNVSLKIDFKNAFNTINRHIMLE